MKRCAAPLSRRRANRPATLRGLRISPTLRHPSSHVALARIPRFLLLTAGLTLLSALSRGGESSLSRSPFAPATVSPGETLFTPLAPAVTGIIAQNPYDDPQMWGARYREFMGGGLGSGVAAGD